MKDKLHAWARMHHVCSTHASRLRHVCLLLRRGSSNPVIMDLTGVGGVRRVAPAGRLASVLLVAVLGGVLGARLAELVRGRAESAGVLHIADSSMVVAPGQVLGHGGEGTAFEAAVGAVRPLAVAEGGVHSMRHPDMVLHSTKLRGTYVPRVRHVCSTCRKVSTYVACIRGTYAAPLPSRQHQR